MPILPETQGRPQHPQPLPTGVNVNDLFAGIQWHQQWEVFDNVFTPGRNPVTVLCDYAGLPADLRGQRVLDIGAWHGCFSFECERRGAAEVVALTLENPEVVGFNRLKNVLNSKVRFVQESVYAMDRSVLGEFDVVLFLGVLYHLRYPLLAIDKIRGVCRGTAFIETHVIDDHFVGPRAAGHPIAPLKQINGDLPATPIWRFYKEDELLSNWSNWFGPNIQAVLEAFESAGFTIQLRKTWNDRAAFAARVKTDLFEALDRTYEGDSRRNLRLLGINASPDNVLLRDGA